MKTRFHTRDKVKKSLTRPSKYNLFVKRYYGLKQVLNKSIYYSKNNYIITIHIRITLLEIKIDNKLKTNQKSTRTTK